MRREYDISDGSIFPTPLFYAPLTRDFLPTIAWDNNLTVYSSSGASIENNSARINSGSGGIMYNCSVPQNVNLTFNCWLCYTGGSGVNYSYGAATKNNAKYKGAQYANIGKAWMVCEYLYIIDGFTATRPEVPNQFIFCSFTIIFNGNHSYTFKFYKNGIKIAEKTITNTTWLEFADCVFAISHFTNSMYAYYKHFSCYEELTDYQIKQLYDNGGIPL